MHKQERQTYWLEMAEYDLVTAKVMLSGERGIYTLVSYAMDKLKESLSKERCEQIINETEALFEWIKTKF